MYREVIGKKALNFSADSGQNYGWSLVMTDPISNLTIVKSHSVSYNYNLTEQFFPKIYRNDQSLTLNETNLDSADV